MPSHEAELILSCKATGTAEVKKFNDAVAEADKTSNQLKDTLARVFSTAVIVGFARKAIGAFSDLQEATQKFYEVFKGLEKEATAEAKKLEEQFGASTRSAKSMLALSGDLLTGFGFSRDEALKLSAQIAQLGSDIASFSNYAGGAEGATIAITKAMLGETEMAKMLGIAIKTDSQEYKELYKRIKETRGTTDSQTKALTALHIAFQQKGTAMGDFARNIDSIANRGRILSNTMETLEANIGRGLAEGFNEGQGALIGLAKSFNDLDEPTQNFIVKTGAIFSGLMVAKTAYGVYNFFSAQAGSIAANNAIQAQAEAKAHIANAEAIEAETKAKQTNQIVSAQRALKENRVEVQKTRHAWKSALVAGEDPRKVEQLRQSYKNLLVERKNLFKASEIAQGNQVIKSFNNSVAMTNMQMANMTKQFKFPTFAAGMTKLKAGFHGIGVAARSVGVALKGMMASMLPMLALSAAIEGVMWLAGKAKREAEAADRIASAQSERVKKEIQANETLRQQDQDKLRRYEELAKLSDRTKSEQEELVSIAGDLNKSYDGLTVPLLKQNDILKDTGKYWDKINEKQRKNRIEEQKNLLAAQRRSVQAKYLLARSSMDNLLLQDTAAIHKSNLYYAMYSNGNLTSVHTRIKNLEALLPAIKNAEEFNAVNDLLNTLIEQRNMLKDYNDMVSGVALKRKEIKKQSSFDGIKREEEKKYNEAVAKAQYEQMGTAQKIVDLQKKRAEYQKEARELENYQNSEKNIKKYYEYKTKILDIDKQITDLQGQHADEMKRENDEIIAQTKEMENKRLQKANEIYNTFRQQQEARVNIWQEMANAGRGFRQTAQESVNSYSLEAVKLQSRMLISPKFTAEQLQKKMAITTEDIKKILESMESSQRETRTAIDTISRNLGVTSY